ncbi:MAG: hypothetical protein R3Y68_07985 [Rikenellaceae bacterium]
MKKLLTSVLCMALTLSFAAAATTAQFVDDFSMSRSKMVSSENITINDSQPAGGLGPKRTGQTTCIARMTKADTGSIVYKVDGVVTGVSADLYYAIFKGSTVNEGYKLIVSGSVDGSNFTEIESVAFADPKHVGYAAGEIPGKQTPEIVVNKSKKYRYVKIALHSTTQNSKGEVMYLPFLLESVYIDYIAK